MVPVPAAPDRGVANVNGVEVGHEAKPVRVTIRAAFEGILAAVVKDTVYLTPVAPANALFVEIIGADVKRLVIAGNWPLALNAIIAPKDDVIDKATLRDACA